MNVIIPAAGLGSRMNMKHDESKEMLPDPMTGKPLIDWTLRICEHNCYNPVIITRKEKQDLITHVKGRAEIVLLEQTTPEWPDTILAGFDKWADKNLLILPDTRWSPTDIVLRMDAELDNHDLVFAVHNVEHLASWGAIEGNQACEKPRYIHRACVPGTAWGVIGFNKLPGIDLFKNFSYRHNWFHLRNFTTLPLDRFLDITRTGTLEKYDA